MGSQKKKKNSFIVNGGILAMASIMVRLIGIIYRVPMTNTIGDAGNGYYGNAYTIYSILLLLSSYSMPLAVSKMVSMRAAVGQWKNVKVVLKSALMFSVIFCGFFALLLGFGAEFFSEAFFNNGLTAIPLRFMAPTIFIMGLVGVFRGFFQGLETTVPTAVSQVLEQILNAVVSVGGAILLFSYGQKLDVAMQTEDYAPAWGAAGGTIGTGVGALVALIFLIVLFRAYRGILDRNAARDKTKNVETSASIMKIIIMTAIPVILSTAVYNIIDLVDSSLFSYYMESRGLSDYYNTIWGAYNGKYLLLVHLPVSFASAMAVSVVPSISDAFAKRNRKLIVHKTNLTIKTVMYVAIPSALGLMVMANPVIKLLFRSDNSDAYLYLTMGGLAVLFFSLSTVTNGILQGINRMSVPVRHSVIALIIHIVVFFALTYGLEMGIYGLIIAYTVFGIAMSTMNCFSITKYMGYEQDIMSIYIKPMIAAIVMGIACFGTYMLMKNTIGTDSFMQHAICVIIPIIVAVIVYFFGTVFLHCISEDELKAIPMGTKVIKIAKKLHIM